jgi:hypothetical protein
MITRGFTVGNVLKKGDGLTPILFNTTMHYVPYFPGHKTRRPVRHMVIFLLEDLVKRKNIDECILILVLYWKKADWLHSKISNHTVIYSS